MTCWPFKGAKAKGLSATIPNVSAPVDTYCERYGSLLRRSGTTNGHQCTLMNTTRSQCHQVNTILYKSERAAAVSQALYIRTTMTQIFVFLAKNWPQSNASVET